MDQDNWYATYDYDAINRLTNEVHGRRQTNRSWTYDWVGNRLDNGFVYNSQTDWLTEGPAGINRQYYSDGSMSERDDVTYEYDPKGLLDTIDGPGLTSYHFVWDAESRLLSSWHGSVGQYYLNDPTASIPAKLARRSEEVPENTFDLYIREPSGSLAALVRLYLGSYDPPKYYHFDALGNTMAITNDQGAVTDRYDYDAWGEVYTDLMQNQTVMNPYRYVGELGYHHFVYEGQYELPDVLQLGVRFYEPGVGRFGVRDAIAAKGESCYAYGANLPTNSTDESGRLPQIDCPRNKHAKDLEGALQRICNALQSGKMDRCQDCATGPKQLQCLKDFCNRGRVQCGSRDCVNHPNWCGHSECTPGEQHPECTVVICDEGFTRRCDGLIPGHPAKDTILHEMMHVCGSFNERSAWNKAAACVREILR